MFKGFRHAHHRHAYDHYSRHMSGWYRRPKYNVPLNISDQGSYYEVTVYATGFEKADIKLSISGNELIIRGKRAIDENNPPDFIRQEFPVRHFERSISLGEGIDTSGITASQENNILYIRMPKNAEASANDRDIEVS